MYVRMFAAAGSAAPGGESCGGEGKQSAGVRQVQRASPHLSHEVSQ